MFGNKVVFVIFYLLFMIPTYFLPYLGSNSPLLIAAWASGGAFPPQVLAHAGALLALMFIAWSRGSAAGKAWLVIFPVLAAVFDFTPYLNYIYLIPTVMHLLAIILGVVGEDAATRKQFADA